MSQNHPLIGMSFPVLFKGFVRVVDLMGDDSSIVQAARVSYGEGTKKVHEDRGLIRYLMRHRHTTPFEMCEIKLHVKVPMDCWRQWIRHRTANVNEYSTRYSEAIDECHQTSYSGWRRQSTTNKQGSADNISAEVGRDLSAEEREFQQHARDVYQHRLDVGVAREQARKDLPLSTFTEAYWKVDLHNLFHFLALRMDGHAQHEIRSYATTIGEKIVKEWCPVAWEAFTDYRLDTMTLTATEQRVVAEMYKCNDSAALAILHEAKLSDREKKELAVKLTKLGVDIPWVKTHPI